MTIIGVGDLLATLGVFAVGLLLGYVIGREHDRRNP